MNDVAAPLIPDPRVLPWCAGAVEHLRTAWAGKRLAHALLLQGPEGVGKASLASWLAAAVLCERSAGGALDVCGQCTSCALINARSHPDLLWVAPEEDKQQIAIDQMRAAADRLTRTSYRRGYKVVVVNPAHQMTPAAANAILKTLEEPQPPCLLILATSQPSQLLPTVRSRCQKVYAPRPGREEAMRWLAQNAGRAVPPALLEFAGGAPLRALELAGGRFEALNEQMVKGVGALLTHDADVTQVATQWEKEALGERLVWLELWLMSLARGVLSGTADRITFPDGPVHLPSFGRALNISAVYAIVDRARALRAQLARTALQRELAIESLLFALLDVLAPAGPRPGSG
jgi:DNA polymerase III subunit delta'